MASLPVAAAAVVAIATPSGHDQRSLESCPAAEPSSASTVPSELESSSHVLSRAAYEKNLQPACQRHCAQHCSGPSALASLSIMPTWRWPKRCAQPPELAAIQQLGCSRDVTLSHSRSASALVVITK